MNTSTRKSLYQRRIKISKCVRCGGDLDSSRRKCTTCRLDENSWRKKTRSNRTKTEQAYYRKNWDRKCIMHSKLSDRKYNRPIVDENYVTPERLRQLRKLQMNLCYWCSTVLQTRNRREPDGLSIERLNNKFPHDLDNVILSCHRCNCKRKNVHCTKTSLEIFFDIWKQYKENGKRVALLRSPTPSPGDLTDDT